MVHALEITRGLLKKDGLLIDIHPGGQPPRVEVHVRGEVHLAGHVQEAGNFVEYFQASDALKDVTGRGLFGLEREEQFPFLYHAPTIAALMNYLENEWIDAVLPEETNTRATALLGEPGAGKEIVVREIVNIARYRWSGR